MNVPAIVLSYIYIKYVFYKSAICIKRPVSNSNSNQTYTNNIRVSQHPLSLEFHPRMLICPVTVKLVFILLISE